MRLLAPIALALSLLVSPSAEALNVGPMAMQLDPLGGRSYDTVIARNTSDRTVAIETYVERRVVDSTGKQTLVPADDDFVVFPPLTSLAPGATQAFRIQYVGDPGASLSSNYYVTVEQLPISLEDAKAQAEAAPEGDSRFLLRLGYAFKIAVGVTSRNAQPNMGIAPIGPGSYTVEGRPTLSARMSNAGSGYAIATQFNVTLRKPSGQTYETRFGDWGEQAGVALFPSGHSRTVAIPVPDASWTSGVTATIEPVRR